MLRTALQNACRARRKARHRCCPRATTTYDGTPAPLACGPWPSSRCPKPHSVCALNTCVGVLRGFLHRGLCDTCPQVGGRSSLGGVPGSYLTTLNNCCRWKVVNERLQSDPMQTLSVSLDGADAAVHCTRGSSVSSTGEHKKQCTQCSFLCLTNGRTRCAGYGICLDYSGSSQATLMSNRMISDFTH